MYVNVEIRATVEGELKRRGLSKTELAEKLGVTPQALSRTLNHAGDKRSLWPAILDSLGLELTVKAKDA